MEEVTKLPHATVFRTVDGLKYFGVLKSIKINKKTMIYELVDSPISRELGKLVNLESNITKIIAKDFVNKIKSKIKSAVLYGSSVKGNLKPESDIDILIILKKHNKYSEKEIYKIAAEESRKLNKTIAINIIDINKIKKEKNSQFIKSVMENMEVLYGKKPFWAS